MPFVVCGYRGYILFGVVVFNNGKTDAEAEIDATVTLNSQEPIQSIAYLKEGNVEEVAITPATDIVVKVLERENNFSEVTREHCGNLCYTFSSILLQLRQTQH
jgi:hypothetical protein